MNQNIVSQQFLFPNNLSALSSINAWILNLSMPSVSPNVPILAGKFSNSFNL